MPSYRASKPSLYGQVGAPNAPTGGVDVAGAIDALTGGATSLIHATMLRKQNERQAQVAADERKAQTEERAYQHGRDEAEDRRHDAELQFKKDEARRDFIIKGGVPEHTEVTPAPTTAQVPMLKAPNPIARAMRPPPALMPGQSATPFDPGRPTTAPLPASTLERTTIPEHVDPERSEAFIRSTETARVRGEIAAETEGRRIQAGKEKQDRQIKAASDAAVVAQRGRMELEKLRQQGKRDAAGNAIRRPMTANAVAGTAAATAEGILAAHDGNREEAFTWLNSNDPDAVKLRGMEKDLPVSWGTYLDNARAKWMKTATAQTLSFQRSEDSNGERMTPAQAAAKVDSTRRIVAGGKKAPPKPSSAAPTAPVKTVTKPPADDFTDDELADAFEAGKKSDADIAAYIASQRKTKKPPVKK